MTMTLETLNARVLARAGAPPAESYTAKLVAEGVGRCARKLGEEAVEAIVAAVGNDRRGLQSEAADVIYHLLVLLRAAGVGLEDVMAELDRRTAQSGLQEKAARPGPPS